MSLVTDCLPPQAIEHEESILAFCLLSPNKVGDILDELRPEHFYKTANQTLFESIKEAHDADLPIDLNNLYLIFKKNKTIDKVGGVSHVASLLDNPIPSSPGQYCKTIKDAFLLRQLIFTANNISQRCFSGGDAEQIVDEAQKKILAIKSDGGVDSVSFKELASEAIDRYEKLYLNRGSLSGITTGFNLLDTGTGGLQNSNLIVLAARPSMGKTALAMNITTAAAKKEIPVGWFSLEMAKAELLDRSVANEARLNSNKFRSGHFENEDWEKIVNTLGRSEKLPIHIDDSDGLHYADIRRKARKMVKKFGCKLFVIDHLQLMRGDKSSTRDREIGSITAALKGMAKELEVPVLLLSQLNRGLESRPNPHKRPVMSDLRDSGNIEQDADVVLFLYRRAVYNDWKNFSHNTQIYSEQPVGNPSPELKLAFEGSTELNIAKQRNGPTFGMNLFWLGKYTSFYDVRKIGGNDK